MNEDIDVTGGLDDCEPIPESIKRIDYEALYRKETGICPREEPTSTTTSFRWRESFTRFIWQKLIDRDNLLNLAIARFRAAEKAFRDPSYYNEWQQSIKDYDKAKEG
jgi:hypothetical protein